MTMICPNCGLRHREAPEGDYAAELDNIRLSKVQRQVLLSLAKERGALTKAAKLIDGVFGDRADGGPLVPLKTIYPAIHKINEAISSKGWIIENDYGRGYRLVRFTQSAANAATEETA